MTDAVHLTDREREYLDCAVPMIGAGSAAMRVTGAVFASLGAAVLSPGSGKAEERLIRTVREIRYTRFKKAVLRKRDNTPKKGDDKILKKLNRTDFILAYETYDSDAFADELYTEYMKKHQ